MKALVTGIGGFVGPYLSEYLTSNKYEVYGTYYNEINEDCNVESTFVDMTDLEQVEDVISKINPDIIFHLAGQSSAAISWKNPQSTFNANVIGTINLLESVRMYCPETRVVLIGSSEEYGIVFDYENPIDENQELRAVNPYSVSKITQENLAKVYIKGYELDIVLTRSFNHTGPRQSTTFVLPEFVSRIVEMKSRNTNHSLLVGNLDAERDFSHIYDVVSAYEVIGRNGKTGEVYNVGSGESYKISELLDYILNKVEFEVEINLDQSRMRPSENPRIVCDNSKLRSLGWELKYDIFYSIDRIFEYYLNSGDEKERGEMINSIYHRY